MKKLGLFIVGLIAVGSFSSCLKRDDFDANAQYELEQGLIREHVNEHIPNATFDENTGIWFELMHPGTPGDYQYKFVENYPNSPIEAPTVQIKYSGRLLNGTQFDATEEGKTATLPLAGVIPAWQLAFIPTHIDDQEVGGLTHMGLHPGARIRFVTPSYLAYGRNRHNAIPANSPLDFTIEVLDVRSPSGAVN